MEKDPQTPLNRRSVEVGDSGVLWQFQPGPYGRLHCPIQPFQILSRCGGKGQLVLTFTQKMVRCDIEPLLRFEGGWWNTRQAIPQDTCNIRLRMMGGHIHPELSIDLTWWHCWDCLSHYPKIGKWVNNRGWCLHSLLHRQQPVQSETPTNPHQDFRTTPPRASFCWWRRPCCPFGISPTAHNILLCRGCWAFQTGGELEEDWSSPPASSSGRVPSSLHLHPRDRVEDSPAFYMLGLQHLFGCKTRQGDWQ